jgi:2-iminobutanoate/2-iminopropanoate deaminase
MLEAIDTGLPKPHSPVNPTVKHGRFIWSGNIPEHVDGRLETGEFELQARLVFQNLVRSLTAAKGSLSDVTFVTIYLTDPRDKSVLNSVYREFFQEPYPCRATVVVKALVAADIRIEVIATAIIGP